MINSSFIEASTPQKEFVLEESVTPTKVDLKKRFCPSNENIQKLAQMARVHHFLRHEELKLVDIRNIDVTVATIDKISIALQGNFDIPDAILRMEEKGVQCGYFTDFLSKYVSEEFLIERDYSFTAIALLHYMKSNNTSVEEAVTELLTLSSSRSICKLCCTDGNNEVEKEQIAKIHNYNILKALPTEIGESERDISLSDCDSLGDPSYTEKPAESSSSEESDNICLVESNMPVTFNPFDSADEDEDGGKKMFAPDCNSTFVFSPFDSDSNPSPGPSNLAKRSRAQIECEHCDAKFSNRNNMKQHLVSVHKIFPPGMNVFSCNRCSFNTGNRVAYERHLQTHSKAVVSLKSIKIFDVIIGYLCFRIQ